VNEHKAKQMRTPFQTLILVWTLKQKYEKLKSNWVKLTKEIPGMNEELSIDKVGTRTGTERRLR